MKIRQAKKTGKVKWLALIWRPGSQGEHAGEFFSVNFPCYFLGFSGMMKKT